MAITVIEAFNRFLADKVDLDPTDSKQAIASRDWLISKIRSFPTKDVGFPLLYTENDIAFGSFARKTKKRPLDDIDLMLCLHAEGGTYNVLSDRIEIVVSSNASRLKNYRHDDSELLNSRKVINSFVSALGAVDKYDKAEIHRNLEAATLKLTSYEWVFDIVPCFITSPDSLGRTFYLIPDGSGHWKKTDPRKDRERVQKINTLHNGHILQVIRILKYWNRRATMPSMPSYLIENMILDFYEKEALSAATQFVDIETVKVLAYITDHVYTAVADPKGIQGNINTLSNEDKSKIWNRAYDDHQKSLEARELEQQEKHQASIAKWKEIFGPEFPDYE